jgi:type II secretory pathway component GspD/PulD (secretin)/tetratricopeptide (TPR) repeat protein
MHRSFESPASFTPSLRRTHAVTAFVAVATIGGLPFAHSPVGLVGTGTHQSPFGLQAAVAAAPVRQAADADRVAAREAMARSEWRRAIDLWNTVLAAAPGDEEAVRNLQLAQAALDQGSAIQSVEQDINIRRERAKVMFESSMTRAREYLEQDNFRQAENTLLNAQVSLDRDKGILSPADYAAWSDEVRRLQEDVSQKRTLRELETAKAQREQARKDLDENMKRERESRERSINESLLRVRQLQLELKYSEALQVIDEILFIDPHNPAALALRDIISTSQMYRRYSDVERRRWASYNALSQRALEDMIPPQPNFTGPGPRSMTGIYEYPEDWPQLSIRRDGAAGYRMSDRDRQTAMDLKKTISVNFSNNQLDQAINYMKSVTGVDFFPDWRSLEDETSVTAEDTISLVLNDVPAEVALKRILEQLGDAGDDGPQFSIEDGVVVISGPEALRAKKFTVVYDIRDLIFEVPYFDNAPEFDLNASIQQGGGGQGGGGQGGGGGGGGFGGGGGGGGFGGGGGGSGGGGGGGGGNIFGTPDDEPERRDRQELIDQIVGIIQEQVDPENWRDTQGGPFTLQELNGNLIITQTARNHQSINDLLAQLRTIRALQINIESRLINVSLEWFEQIGIDLDLYFNTNDKMFKAARTADPNFQLSDFFYQNQPANSQFNNGDLKNPVIFDSFAGSNEFANTTASGAQFGQPDPNDPTQIQYVTGPVGTPIARQSGWSPIGVTQNSLDLTDALATAGISGGVGAAAIATPALNMGISYLDDIQVDLLIKATQADQRNVVLTAPRLTLFNGQRSWISVAKAISYISGLTPITGDSAGAFQPDVGVVYEGFVLDVEAVISADRRYVTMTVQFGLNENVSFREVTFSGAAGAGDLAGRGSSQFEASFQLPELQGTQIATTVSVPDKGTILLGGQRVVNEFEVETGVPILSKIPIVNRFFTNRVTSRTELTTLLLIRPEVIIQQENEDALFPGLSDQIGGGFIQ